MLLCDLLGAWWFLRKGLIALNAQFTAQHLVCRIDFKCLNHVLFFRGCEWLAVLRLNYNLESQARGSLHCSVGIVPCRSKACRCR